MSCRVAERLIQTANNAWRPPPRLTVSQWADLERQLSRESSSEPGQWQTSRAEYQRGMMDAVNDPRVETVVIITSSQIGKTELLNNVLGFYISHDAAPILVVQPTVEMAELWSKDRLTPMIRDTPILRSKVSDQSRHSGNTILHKSFAGGYVAMLGANSPSSLASRPVRIILADEVDRYPASAGKEGDPLFLLYKRTNNFWNRKIILTSTPTVKGDSRIEAEFLRSDQRRYFMPCPHCGHRQILKWANIVFDKNNLDSVVYACEQGCVIEEHHKPRMLKNGEWIATAPFSLIAGFHLNELYSPWRTWRQVVTDFLKAKDTPELLKVWTNTSMGETWEEKGEQLDHAGLLNRREAYDKDSLPDEILVITASVDVQKDRLEALSQGWGEDKERWNIEHKIFWGDPQTKAVWKELDAWLKQSYSVGSVNLKAACAYIDSGYLTDHVYDFVKPKQGRRVFAGKGSSEYYAPIASKPSQQGRQRVMLYKCGTDTAKDSIIFSSLEIEKAGPGFIHFPQDVDEEFFKQLTAEQRFLKKGRFKWKTKRDRNEILDLHVYNLCAYAILNPDINKIKARRDSVKVEAVAPELARSTQRPRPLKRKKKNWITDIK